MFVLVDDGTGGVRAVRARLGHRVAAHVLADRIDRELAGGGSAEATVSTALRARALTSTRARRALAAGVRRVVDEAAAPVVLSAARLPLNRERVQRSAEQFDELNRALLGGGPVSVRGVALTRRLLTEAGGELRGRYSRDDLAAVVRRATEALDILDTAMA